MKIYIGVTTEPSQETQIAVRRGLISGLTNYYGAFAERDVLFFPTEDNVTRVFVMDKAKYQGHDRDIDAVISAVIRKVLSIETVETRLGYGVYHPNFNPIKPFSSTGTVGSKMGENRSPQTGTPKKPTSEEYDYDKLSENYHAEKPRYSFEQVILPDALRLQIEEAVGTIQVEHKVFDEWGLRTIIPNASSALSFYGPPGTGKSMAAEAIAQKLGKRILRATYADIESKFHGEGPKMVKAIFRAAERDDAVLFLDESDSLLSKRLTNVTDGSAQAINSMRSQLLICLEQFKGIIIFATNLVVNYDKAFLSRLINIEFPSPDADARFAIWKQHLMGPGLRIPLDSDVDLKALADQYEFCGREIKNSVKDACVSAAIARKEHVSQADLLRAAEKTKVESEKVLRAEDHTVSKKVLTDEQKSALKDAVQKKLNEEKIQKDLADLDMNAKTEQL